MRLGYNGPATPRLACENLLSASLASTTIDEDLAAEARLGRIAGPFATHPLPNLICSPLGSVAKKNSSKRRRIHHLSWPRGGDSVNAFIEDMACSYQTFDDAVAMVLRLGRGCYLAKIDIKAAFRCIPVHPDDWCLLGMFWRGQYWVDLRLPFGLKSSPAIWERYATAIQWIAHHEQIARWLIHYVDDFLLAEKTKRACISSTLGFLKLLQDLGAPPAPEKLELPATQMLFVGILLDTVNLTASLDEARVREILGLLTSFSKKSTCTLKELQSLLGKLHFASRGVRAGRVFTNRMLELIRNHARKHLRGKPLVLPDGFQKDIAWWLEFLPTWNGISILGDLTWRSSDSLHLYTDASGWGFGAVLGNQWMHGPWTAAEKASASKARGLDMSFLEFLALFKAIATWGDQWKGMRIVFHCDNEACVEVINNQRYRADSLGDMLRSSYMIAAHHQFEFRAAHIPGMSNTLADLLSRDQVAAFRISHPNAALSPTTPLPTPTHNS